ncbi:DNA alkylation repair protein [Agarivorans sp. 1_MG-2023]|uniref:DNA alkylation repair protein n=1 Tax=Agarivorans sp. 1_MG-2023 TaxID=3062634 RepID=UPI0026E34694|nr:DNA alkylation repair protein [Agarivorans sp. 1_MG-2023]MDO6766065.1 DNA alkylation repair protein [Agarivorans sp. 1_MG-2023]
MDQLAQIKQALRKHADAEKAAFIPRYFQAYAGGYGEGDQFLGIRVPDIRKVAKTYPLAIEELDELISSAFHEERFFALVVLCSHYQKSKTRSQQQQVIDFYLQHVQWVNNWDLVDCSAPKIIGPYIWQQQDKDLLERFAASDSMWQQRIAMVSCFYYIRQNDSQLTLSLAERFRTHHHPLMHKAVGWMLRELAKRNQHAVEGFLQQHLNQLPRELLRYSIERFDEPLRKAYLSGDILK